MSSLKNLATALILTLAADAAQSATVHSASVDPVKQVITVDVSYGGGCKEHDFKLKFKGGCMESYPVQCHLVLEENSHGDMCEAMIGKRVQFTFAELGLNDGYFNGAYLTIFGDNQSRATVSLPFRR